MARPAAPFATMGAWLGRRRLMAIDGFVLDLPDTPTNLEEFPKDSAGGYETAFAQARVVAISVRQSRDRRGGCVGLLGR